MTKPTNKPDETPLTVAETDNDVELKSTTATRHCGDPYQACCLPYKTDVFPNGWCNCNCGDCRVAKYVAAEQANQEQGIAK